MLTAVLVAGLALVLALLLSLHRRVSALPVRVWSLARNEREANETKALDAMKEAVAARVGTAVLALKRYEDQMGEMFRAQTREAMARVKTNDRQATDALAVLQAASALVRDLREAADRLARVAGAPQAAGAAMGATCGVTRSQAHRISRGTASRSMPPETSRWAACSRGRRTSAAAA